MNSNPPYTGAQPIQNENPAEERKLEYCGGFSMMKPDEKKREQIRRNAEKEAKNFEAYKTANRPNYNIVKRVDGQPIGAPTLRSPGTLRPIPGQPVRPGAIAGTSTGTRRVAQIHQRNAVYKNIIKEKEEQEMAEKKTAARRQTESNSARESERKRRLDADRRLKNDAFLAKFEKK